MLGHIAWWTLIAVILVAAVIGILFITRGTAVRRVRGVARIGVPVGATEPEFAATVTSRRTGASLRSSTPPQKGESTCGFL